MLKSDKEINQSTAGAGADGAVHMPRKAFSYKNGRIWFSKATERNFFFVLTFIMLVAGILVKLGLW